MKKNIISSVFFCTMVSLLHAQTVDKNFHVYLLVGQSNMSGRGKIDSASKIINARIFMLDKKNNWVPATDPLHFDKPDVTGVGPGMAFAKEMINENDSIKIGLVPSAWGGSPIKVWEPDSAYLTGHPYDDAVKRTTIAMQSGVLKGVLWHQGESDNNVKSAHVYMEKLKILIERFRAAFHNPQLPFIVGEIGQFNTNTIINTVLNNVPQQVPYTAVVSSAGLRDRGDKTHFDTPSARELGIRYAIAMKKLFLRKENK